MVVVVGGGVTGLGIAWDLVLRGIPVTVVEEERPGRGTSGRFHGLLHSGGRYAVTDPAAARDCMAENRILRRIAPGAVEATGGYFVEVEPGEDAFAGRWQEGCRAAGIPVAEVDPDALRRRLPGLTPAARRAFQVPDAVLEGFHLLALLEENIRRRGGRILSGTRVNGFRLTNGRVQAVVLAGPEGPAELDCDLVVNAAGPWAGEVSRLYGDPIPMRLSAGMMVVFAYRRIGAVVNRLAPPGDGDILVPHQAVTILGTTDVPQAEPEPPVPGRREAVQLLELGARLFPQLPRWRVLRAYTGVRPLYQPGAAPEDPRKVTRDFAVIDHAARGGPAGVLAVVGGKFTTFRLMAERVGDRVAAVLGVDRPSLTARTRLEMPPAPPAPEPAPRVCECEQVTLADLEPVAGRPLDEWRTRTWFAMGPCQGTFCAHRAVPLRARASDPAGARAELAALRRERSRGLLPVLWGANAREWALQQAVRSQVLGEGWAHE